jgi:hypothetical protein
MTRETLTALNKDELKKVFFDAMKDANQPGVQLPNKRKPRVAWLNLVIAEIDRRRR